MKVDELVENLRTHLEAINDEKIELINFDSLKDDLKHAAEVLLNLDQKRKLCDKLLVDTKSEIKRMSLAISRAKNDTSTLSLTDRLLDAEELDYGDLILLKRQVKAEFDRTFPGRPVHKLIEKGQSFDFKIGEFKIGKR
jgi:hypothetical protein